MRAPKLEFIEKYILPIFDPFISFFGKYGVHKLTVIMIPILIVVLIAIKGEIKSKSKTMLTIYLICIVFILIVLIKYQLLGY